MSRPVLAVRRLGAVCIALSVAGCTGTLSGSGSSPSTSGAQPLPRPPRVSSSDHAPLHPGSTVTSKHLVAIAEQKALSCSDSTNGEFEAEGSLIAGDLVFEGLKTPGDLPPTVADLHIGGAGSTAKWHFRKVVLYVRPNVRGRFTITVDSPDQALAWMPADLWGTTSLDIGQWASGSTTVAGCGQSTSSRYFGGILASDPTACVHLTVAAAGGSTMELQRRLNGEPCVS